MEQCCTCITYKHDERRKIPGIHKLTLARYIVDHQQKNRNRHSAEYYWILQHRLHPREKMLIWVNRIIIYTQDITTCKILVSKQKYSKCKIIHKPNFAVISAK